MSYNTSRYPSPRNLSVSNRYFICMYLLYTFITSAPTCKSKAKQHVVVCSSGSGVLEVR